MNVCLSFRAQNLELHGTFRFWSLFMILINVFVGSGIPRDELELVGERYGVLFIVVVSFFFYLVNLLLVGAFVLPACSIFCWSFSVKLCSLKETNDMS